MNNNENFKKWSKLGFLAGSVVVVILIVGFVNLGIRSSFSLCHMDEQVISIYLNKEVMDPSFGGEVFNAYEVLKNDKNQSEVYIWALIQEYYESDSGFEPGTGMSVPMVLHVDWEEDSLEIKSHTIPRDGSYYPEDIKALFPKRIQEKILNYPSRHIEKLLNDIEGKVKTE